jgi:hypothetical protein
MASHSFTITSSLTVQDAFARLVDLERVPEWDEGVASSVRIEAAGETGPATPAPVGDRFDVTVTGFDGSPTSVVYEITEADAPRRFVMVGENDEFRAADTLELEATANGCELAYHGTLELLGDDPPLTPSQLDSMFPKLAAVAEAGLRRFLDAAE